VPVVHCDGGKKTENLLLSTNTDVLHAGVWKTYTSVYWRVHSSAALNIPQRHSWPSLRKHERERERDVCHLRVLVLFRSEETQNCFQRYNDGGVRDRKCVSDIMADV